MNHQEVYTIFKDLIPFYAEKTEEWFPCGRNAIRVRLHGGDQFIFSVIDQRTWRLESMDYYINSMKGDNRM